MALISFISSIYTVFHLNRIFRMGYCGQMTLAVF